MVLTWQTLGVAVGIVVAEHTIDTRPRPITTPEPVPLPANNGQCDCQVQGISTDLNSGDEDHTDSHSGCESALAHNHAQLHKKLGTTEGSIP